MPMAVNESSCEEIVVLDFETTGLSTEYDRVIEVAAITIKNKKVINTFIQLMNPGKSIPSFISSLTGITNEMVKGKPSPEKVMPKLMKFIGNRPVIAHNASFDKRFLLAEMERAGLSIENHFLCTMVLSRKLIPDAYNHKLTTLASHLNIKSTKAHRALSDVHMTAKLWQHINTKVIDRTGIKKPDLALLTAISKKPKSAIEKYFERIRKAGV
jgi:DNA polymerase-3 subunit epsilon